MGTENQEANLPTDARLECSHGVCKTKNCSVGLGLLLLLSSAGLSLGVLWSWSLTCLEFYGHVFGLWCCLHH